MRPRYLLIFEDGTLSLYDVISSDVFEAYDQGLYDLIDMDTGMYWAGDEWVKIESNDWK